MKLLMFGLLSVASLATQAQEVRWCSGSKLAEADQLLYPPIARAAHIGGIVIARIQYRPGGSVVGADIVSGYPMLATALRAQVAQWHISTSTAGDALCQTLLIANFTYGDQKALVATAPVDFLRLSVHAEELFIIDEAATLGRRRRFHL